MTEIEESKSKIVYLSISKKNFGQRFKAMRMASERKLVPVYPDIVADLAHVTAKVSDREAREKERFEQIRKSSEVWVIGEINREISEDIELAKRLAKKIRYFEPTKANEDLKEIEPSSAKKGGFF